MKVLFIIVILLSLPAFTQAQKEYVPTIKREAVIVTCPDSDSGFITRSYKRLRGLRRFLKMRNREMGTNYPTAASSLKELAAAAQQYSEDKDHVYQFTYRIFTRYRYKRVK